jgi:hypothetical protein
LKTPKECAIERPPSNEANQELNGGNRLNQRKKALFCDRQHSPWFAQPLVLIDLLEINLAWGRN